MTYRQTSNAKKFAALRAAKAAKREAGEADCYRVMVDGELWKKRIGFARALAGLRKSLPRVMSL